MKILAFITIEYKYTFYVYALPKNIWALVKIQETKFSHLSEIEPFNNGFLL